MSYEIEYSEKENLGSVYEDGYCIATLDFNTDTFESFDEMEKEIEDDLYDEMEHARNTYEADDYDVREEQGLYGYGY
ncbi:MAG: hypothetical protein ACPGRW_06075 [Flavobacteriaceae bacterium]